MEAKILIVDDEANLRKTMRLILTQAGFDVVDTDEGSTALEMLKEAHFDLVFVDLTMPGMSGIEILREVRKIKPELPVMILTANATLDTAMEAVHEGARDYLLKPADPKLIITRIREILGEIRQPVRQREIVSEIQALVSELQTVTNPGEEVTQGIFNTLPAADPERFITKGVFTLDLHARHLMLKNKYLPLAPSNFDYMVTMVRHSPEPLSYQELVKESQGYDVTMVEAREMVRWRVHELRKVLEPDSKNPRYLITVRGKGYRLIS